MNKSIVKKMTALKADLQMFEEDVEKKFSAKTVAIVKYRVGAEDGTIHDMEDTAKHFEVSTTWVGKVTKQVADFCKEMKVKKTKVATKKPEVKTGEPRRIAVMSASIINGKVTVKHADPELAAEVQSDLQKMIDEKGITTVHACEDCEDRMALGKEAYTLNNKASSRGAWAFIAFISALLLGIAITIKADVYSPLAVLIGYLGVMVISFAGLLSYISGVAYTNRRDGILEGLRRL